MLVLQGALPARACYSLICGIDSHEVDDGIGLLWRCGKIAGKCGVWGTWLRIWQVFNQVTFFHEFNGLMKKNIQKWQFLQMKGFLLQ